MTKRREAIKHDTYLPSTLAAHEAVTLSFCYSALNQEIVAHACIACRSFVEPGERETPRASTVPRTAAEGVSHGKRQVKDTPRYALLNTSIWC